MSTLFYTDDMEKLDEQIRQEIITKEDAEHIETYTMFRFDALTKTLYDVEVWYGEREDVSKELKALKENNILGEYKLPDYTPNIFYNFVLDEGGPNVVGDTPLEGFTIPENKLNNSFQKVALLSNKNEPFKWLPFDLAVICPIYLGFHYLWLDYTNPLKPEVFKRETFEEEAYNDEILKEGTKVTFDSKRFRAEKGKPELYGVGFSGAINSGQGILAPSCPKTGNTMRFVCQFGSGDHIKVADYSLAEGNERFATYYEYMAMAVDQNLYVFFEPTSRLVCITISG